MAYTLKVEIAFASGLTGAGTWTDVSAYVRGPVQIRRGRQNELGQSEAGSCSLILNNLDRRFDPTHASSPYVGNLLPRKRIRVSVTIAAVDRNLFYGFIDPGFPMDWPATGKDSVVALDSQDGFLLAGTQRLVDHVFPAEDAITRVTALVALVPGIQGLTYTSVGTVALAAEESYNGTVLQALQEAANAEGAVMFMQPTTGNLVFQPRHYRMLFGTSVTATLGDAGGSEIPYTALGATHGEFLYNHAVVTPRDADPVEVEDATSVAAYGRSTITRQIAATEPGYAYDVASFLVGHYKDPKLRFPNVALDAGSLTEAQQVSQATLGPSTRLNVKRTPPGGGSRISQDVFLEGVAHTLTRDKVWTTSWDLSGAADTTGYWILGTSTLGTGTVLGY